MATQFDTRMVGEGKNAADFIIDTEYTIIGKDMEGAILLWSER